LKKERDLAVNNDFPPFGPDSQTGNLTNNEEAERKQREADDTIRRLSEQVRASKEDSKKVASKVVDEIENVTEKQKTLEAKVKDQEKIIKKLVDLMDLESPDTRMQKEPATPYGGVPGTPKSEERLVPGGKHGNARKIGEDSTTPVPGVSSSSSGSRASSSSDSSDTPIVQQPAAPRVSGATTASKPSQGFVEPSNKPSAEVAEPVFQTPKSGRLQPGQEFKAGEKVRTEAPMQHGMQEQQGPQQSGRPAKEGSPQQTTIEEWRAAGMSDAGIAGVLANIKSESNFNPNLRHEDQPRFQGEARYAHGHYQMGGEEWNKYDAWLKKNYPKEDWKDPRLQDRFAAQHIKEAYPKVWEKMLKGTKEEAAQAFVKGYEKPAARYLETRLNQYGKGVPSVDHYLQDDKAAEKTLQEPGKDKDKQSAEKVEPLSTAKSTDSAKEGNKDWGKERLTVPKDIAKVGYNKNIVKAGQEASKYLPEGYRVEVESGNRPGDKRFHGKGQAVDFQIYRIINIQKILDFMNNFRKIHTKQ
jgi:hypothetical protein